MTTKQRKTLRRSSRPKLVGFDTRFIVNRNGAPSLSKAAGERGESLCGRCGVRHECRLPHNAIVCGSYAYPIPFSVLTNLEATETLNTFRLSGAWPKRVQPGDRVALVNTKTSAIIRLADVAYVDIGDLDEMLTKHAENNHAVFGLSNAGDRLRKILRNAYGSNFLALGRAISVVGFHGRQEEV